ncbi:MAG: hypothetical protein AAGA30_19890, partial [Planctomycetota bacterium]
MLKKNLVKLRNSISDLGGPVKKQPQYLTTTEITEAASITSARQISLQTQSATATTLSSSNEINSISTSYSTEQPRFSKGSATRPTISGVYDGSQGDNTLRFEVTQGGKIGRTRHLEIEVKNSLGESIDTLELIDYQRNTQVSLSNGIEVSFGRGRLFEGDYFELDVSASQGQTIDADAEFRSGNTNFEEGVEVKKGAFEINGEKIRVRRRDSINSIIEKINKSDAGVNASYSAETERIELVQTEVGANEISLANDSSGFLAAVKLDEANTVLGQEARDDLNNKISDVAAFAGVNSGSIVINGRSTRVDVLNDSINDVVNRLNQANEIEATIDDGRIKIRSQTTSDTLEISDNGTGLLAAIDIAEGSFDPVYGETTTEIIDFKINAQTAQRIEKQLGNLGESFNNLFDNSLTNDPADQTTLAVREKLQS